MRQRLLRAIVWWRFDAPGAAIAIGGESNLLLGDGGFLVIGGGGFLLVDY